MNANKSRSPRSKIFKSFTKSGTRSGNPCSPKSNGVYSFTQEPGTDESTRPQYFMINANNQFKKAPYCRD